MGVVDLDVKVDFGVECKKRAGADEVAEMGLGMELRAFVRVRGRRRTNAMVLYSSRRWGEGDIETKKLFKGASGLVRWRQNYRGTAKLAKKCT